MAVRSVLHPARSSITPAGSAERLYGTTCQSRNDAYFTVCEAVTNALKHSGATRVLVEATVDCDRLVVAVCDDGVGGASETGGSGLIGLRDRVSAEGGTILVDSRIGAGTTLTAEFPCES